VLDNRHAPRPDEGSGFPAAGAPGLASFWQRSTVSHRQRWSLPMDESPIEPRQILDHIQDGLLIVDLHGRVLWTNQVFREMVGREDQELAGQPCCELGIGSFCKEHCPLTEGEHPCQVNFHFNVAVEDREGKGQPRAYCLVRSPLQDSEGQLVGYMENFRDMARVRDVILQLEEVNQAISREREKTEALVDSLADGVFVVDQELRIRRFSRNMEQMLGVEAAEALGRPCREVLGGTLCDTDCPLLWSGRHGQPVTGCRETLTTRSGRSIPVSISTGFLRNEPDFQEGLYGVVTDRSEVEALRQELDGRAAFHGLVGASVPMRALFHQIEAVAPTDATVLITGESGTGKELVARALHRLGTRAQGPFVGVNCAALADELLESELFGHVRGAFTGAVRDRRGRFEMAAGGTLFLDEVESTSPALQAKLLRAIQEKTIEPVGSESSRRVDVRIVAATNKDLATEVRAGRFRDDLYYRLNVIPIHVPPLRSRSEDVPLLVQHFIRKYRAVYRHGVEESFEGISERALSLMMEYPWPGNVRELENAVEYALISSDRGRIERAFLPQALRALAPGGAEGGEEASETASADLPAPEAGQAPSELETLRAALDRNRWSMDRTAADLGVSRTTLWRRMRQLGLRK
jgi:PAS domain S-box-containing protein